MRRFKKRKKKLRGNRTHGRGTSEHGRGKGSRMGRGSVKTSKKNFMHTVKYEPWRLPQNIRGFHSPVEQPRAINLRDVERLAGDSKEVDLSKLGSVKVLGGGRVTKPLTIIAYSFSKGALEKIKAVGGKAVSTVSTTDSKEDKDGS